MLYTSSLCVEFIEATVEPHNLTVEVTMSVKLSCIVNGFMVDNMNYSWEVTQVGERAEVTQLSNTTSSHLLLQNVSTSTGYRCVITNSSGTITASPFSYVTIVGKLSGKQNTIPLLPP